MKKLMAILFVLVMAGCGTLTDQDKASGLKAGKCLANCAIVCGASGALGASSCTEYSREALQAEGVKAAQCLATCAIQCGLQAVATAQAKE